MTLPLACEGYLAVCPAAQHAAGGARARRWLVGSEQGQLRVRQTDAAVSLHVCVSGMELVQASLVRRAGAHWSCGTSAPFLLTPAETCRGWLLAGGAPQVSRPCEAHRHCADALQGQRAANAKGSQLPCSTASATRTQGCWCFRFHDGADAEKLQAYVKQVHASLCRLTPAGARLACPPSAVAASRSAAPRPVAGRHGAPPLDEDAIRRSVARILREPSFQGTQVWLAGNAFPSAPCFPCTWLVTDASLQIHAGTHTPRRAGSVDLDRWEVMDPPVLQCKPCVHSSQAKRAQALSTWSRVFGTSYRRRTVANGNSGCRI